MPSSDSIFQAITLHLVTPGFGTHVLERHSFNDLDHLDDDSELRIVADKVVSNTSHSTVFRGKTGDRSFIIKTCYNNTYRKDFSNETRAYETMLSELQGEVIPRFYGYFKGFGARKSRISCIVLEDCGDIVDTIFEYLPEGEKLKILTVLGKFHKHGFHPSHFSERNVVVRDGQYRLIDFHRLLSHECYWHEEMAWRPGDYFYDVVKTIPCRLLITIGRDMEVWRYNKDPVVTIGGLAYDAQDYPPQEIIDQLLSVWYRAYVTSHDVLVDCLKRIKEEMDEKGTNFDIKAKINSPPDFPFVLKLNCISKS